MLAAPQLSFAPDDPHIVYDLVVQDRVAIDPAQALHGPRDVAIRNGKIAAILECGTCVKTTQTIDAAGKLVTPGLVDLHAHYYHQVSGVGLPADELMQLTDDDVPPGSGNAASAKPARGTSRSSTSRQSASAAIRSPSASH